MEMLTRLIAHVPIGVVPEVHLESTIVSNIERSGRSRGGARVVLKAQGAVTRTKVVPAVGDKSGIKTSVIPAIEAASTFAVLEAIKTKSHPYRFSVGSNCRNVSWRLCWRTRGSFCR